MANSNHHAYVVPVVLQPHPDPETTRLSVVSVNAYTCVVATEDWQGITKAIYIQPDTVCPDTPDFAFLKRNNSARASLQKELEEAKFPVEVYSDRLRYIEESEMLDKKKLRITAKRLRGVQSFGMLWPVTDDTLQVGDDAWELMGFQRYEPPLPAGSGDDWTTAPDLPWLYDYDVENYFNFPDVFQLGEEVVATEKLDGANARFTYAKDRETGDYKLFCGSKQFWMKDTPTSMWWRAFRANPWVEEFCKAHPDWVLYGEVFGNVQKLKYGVKPNQPNMIRVFDALAVDHFIDYVDFETMFTEKQRVPVVYRGPWEPVALRALSLGKSTLADHLREGIVVHPIRERRDLALGRVKLKLVSFDLLAKG